MSETLKINGAFAEMQRQKTPPEKKFAEERKIISSGFNLRLQLIVDSSIYLLLLEIKVFLEAPSLGDVIRQAVRCFALEYAKTRSINMQSDELADNFSGEFKRLDLRVPIQTKERLDFLADITGLTYTDIVVSGVTILWEMSKTQNTLLNNLELENQSTGSRSKRAKNETQPSTKHAAPSIGGTTSTKKKRTQLAPG